MKRKNFVLLFFAAAFMILCFTQCHKERSCGATITCMYHPDPSVAKPVVGAVINIDTLGKYTGIDVIDTILETDHGDSVVYHHIYLPISDTLHHLFPHATEQNGSYSFQLPHPALLALKATWEDTTQEPALHYVGYTQITLEEGVLNKQDTIWLEPEN